MFNLNSIRTVLQGKSNRDALTLMTGTGLAQLIPLVAAPFLSRIYAPEQFGVLALFAATVSSVSVLATGRYELAIMLPRKNVDAVNVATLAVALSVVASTMLLALIYTFNKPISGIFGNGAMSTWLYFVPLAVLLNGIYLSLNYWSNRNKLYLLMAHRRVLQSGGMSAVQLGMGLVRSDAGGLVIGSIFGQALAGGMMLNVLRHHTPHLWRHIDKRKMWALAKRYKSCPKLLVPAHMLSALSIQLPAVFIAGTFGLAASGFYLFAERLVGMPVSLVSASIGDVFRQEMAEHFAAGENCRAKFVSTLRKLLAIATPPFILLTIFSPPVFALTFGEKWRISGEYAQLMCPMFYMHFISNPLSLVAIVAQKNRFELLWQASLLVVLLAAAALHYFTQINVKYFIAIFVVISIIFDVVNLAASYRFSCAGDLGPLGRKTT